MAVKKNLRKEKGGNVLIEFALLAPIFFMLIMGLIEFVLYQYKVYALNHVVYEATRNLQTGEVKNAGNTSAAFLAEMCAHSGLMIECDEIDYDVRHYDTIQQIQFTTPTFNADGHATNFDFDPGDADDYTVVRASIPHSFVTPFMNNIFGTTTQPAIVNSYQVVRNEPWN